MGRGAIPVCGGRTDEEEVREVEETGKRERKKGDLPRWKIGVPPLPCSRDQDPGWAGLARLRARG